MMTAVNRHYPAMNRPFRVDLWLAHDATPSQRDRAQEAFAEILSESLGDARLVLPIFTQFTRIMQQYGESPDPEDLTDEQRTIYESWRLAEQQAMQAVFGVHRYMGEGLYEILPNENDE